jgi:hypothetical protein
MPGIPIEMQVLAASRGVRKLETSDTISLDCWLYQTRLIRQAHD